MEPAKLALLWITALDSHRVDLIVKNVLRPAVGLAPSVSRFITILGEARVKHRACTFEVCPVESALTSTCRS
jgi:hypothetical protein